MTGARTMTASAVAEIHCRSVVEINPQLRYVHEISGKTNVHYKI